MSDAKKGILILDKSVLHVLGIEDLRGLAVRYALNIPPVLLYEIRGDLSKSEKKNKDKRSTRDCVKDLACRLALFRNVINVRCDELVRLSLLGEAICMDGHRVGCSSKVPPPERLTAADEHLLKRLQRGISTVQDCIDGAEWRRVSRGANVELHRNTIAGIPSDLGKPTSLPEALEQAAQFLNNDCDCSHHLTYIATKLHIPQNEFEHIGLRWKKLGCPPLSSFAPYACFCVRADLLYRLALRADLIGTGHTCLVDIQYLFYLPFCTKFMTGDVFQYDFAKMLARPDQEVELVKKTPKP